MVEISPFCAIRYNTNKISNFSKVICPPYDVIATPEYHQLLERHPANLVRVELPLTQGKEDRYQVAARYWARWQRQRLLLTDFEAGYYGYEQRFMVGTQTYTRRGFFAALRLERPGKGHVRPHERTFPKHKEDRLHLMRATHANISPIFGIFFDRQQKAQALLDTRMSDKPLVLTRDDKGVTHRLWRWSDPTALRTLSQVLRSEDVLIADGHHRYETAWTYACERADKDRSADTKQRAYRYVMIFLCPLTDPGLVIQPTHRSVRWEGSLQEWQKRIGSDCSLQPVDSFNALLARLRSSEKHTLLGMILEGGKLFWLKPKPGRISSHRLPVEYLHGQILKDIPLENITYSQDPRQMIENIHRSQANVAFLLPPPDKEAFAAICRVGRLLPQKSTYFYPKISTGFVMRSLDGNVT